MLAEFSMVKVRKTRLEELAQQGEGRAELALKIEAQLDSYLSAVQLGITLTSLGLGWIGEPAVVSLIEPAVMYYFPGSTLLLHTISVAVGFSIITLLHVVLGELIPKSIAIQQAERMTLLAVWPLYIFHKVGYPIITIFDRTAWAVLKLLGFDPAQEAEIAHSEEELRMIVSASQRGGILNQMESELIDNVFDFADRLSREIMVPRQDMVCLFLDDSYEENMQVVHESGHTRYPVCLEDKDHVLGMVHIRDLVDLSGSGTKDLKKIMREILVVPEGMSVAKLLQLMRRKRTHLAVVADEYGGTAGLVALEDVLEEIVGEIQDEHDMEETEIQRFSDGSYEFDGRVLLDDLVELLDLELEEHEEDTIGGYIFGMLGRRPEIGDQLAIDNYRFEVLKVAGFRVVRVKATMIPPADQDPPEE
ncbi:hemolysin family protein [Acetonema longum]|uniref:hemolysin family protein n=1 Tax=Acetonema longum TaxID=2374 RepID=UPI0002E7A96A|nr:hemolysin family protein [Acetonema longum]